jgi:hypothetical protein
MDDYFSVEVSDPGQEYWNMDPIVPTYNDELSWGDNTPTYDYENYDFQGPTYDEMGYETPYQEYGPTYQEMGYDQEYGPTYQEMGYEPSQGGYYGGGDADAQEGGFYGGGPNERPMPGYGQPQQTRGYGQQQPQQRQQPGQPQQNRGLLGGLFGGGGGGGGGGGFGDILGTLGGLALVGGVGALLGSMLSNKSSGGGTPSPISMPGSNLTPTKLASPGMNPGYAMGASAAPVMGSTTSNLGKLISPGAIAPIPPGMM